ncbi:MAG: hypothetical protein KDA61_18625 [Planctomycetales bacterium]|nr:hypothetical protein [Planctomycetales bacterium]
MYGLWTLMLLVVASSDPLVWNGVAVAALLATGTVTLLAVASFNSWGWRVLVVTVPASVAAAVVGINVCRNVSQYLR